MGVAVRFECRVEAGTVVEDSILFDRMAVGPGAEVRRAILDKGVRGLRGAPRGFEVREGGVTSVAKDVVVGGREGSA
jgi:glucose-1-phosphate adenylyltransferase